MPYKSIEISATEYWISTGLIYESKNVLVNVQDSGLHLWKLSGQNSNCNSSGYSVKASVDYLLPGYNAGCLIGKIGKKSPFWIGMDGFVPFGMQGEFFQSINGLSNHASSNSGKLTVLVYWPTSGIRSN